ncbi:MAG TPA: hypothetical protein VGN00_29250 [Puia sp.]|jgi:hypothetical protein
MKSVQGQQAFYAPSLLLVTVVTIVISGCGASSSQPAATNQFTLKPGKVDNFYVLCSSLDDAKKPRYIKYLFTGTLQNNTNNIYSEGTIKMKMSITLENGTILTEKDLNDIPFNDILSHQFLHNWKPGQTFGVNRLVSISIPVEYADYPVKDVVVEYSAKLVDKINQTQENDVITSVSVMDKWKAVVKKAKVGRTDADDDNFPAKILNGKVVAASPEDGDKKELIDE